MFLVFNHLRLLLRFDRTVGLLTAIQRSVKKGDVVLDAGCGSGTLGLLALKNGASQLVGVDSNSIDFARELAETNGFSSNTLFMQSKLEDLNLKEYKNKFDLIISMIYQTTPIRDEGQHKIIFDLKEKYLKKGGKILPGRVQYFAYVCEWPSFDINKRMLLIDEQIRNLEGRYQLSFAPFFKHTRNEIDWKFVPDRDRVNGKILKENSDLFVLSHPVPFCTIDYNNNDTFAFPREFPIKISHPGKINLIMWVQELWFQDILIFSNETISFIENSKIVTPGDNVTIHLDNKWRKTNIANRT